MSRPAQMASQVASPIALLERLSLSFIPRRPARIIPSIALLRSLSAVSHTSASDTIPPPPSPTSTLATSNSTSTTKQPYNLQRRSHYARVIRAGTMAKTIKVRTYGQKWDRKLRKNYPWHETMLCHDEEGVTREGDTVKILKWLPEERRDELGRLKSSKRVGWQLEGIVTPFGEPVEQRKRMWVGVNKQAGRQEKNADVLDNETKGDLEKFAREATAETKGDDGLLAQGLKNEIEAEERSQKLEEEGGSMGHLRKKAEQVGR